MKKYPALDLCNVCCKKMGGLLDERFKIYPFVEDYETGDFVTHIDYRPEGAKETATVQVRLERTVLDTVKDGEPLVDYVRGVIVDANEDLVGFVDGDEWDGQ